MDCPLICLCLLAHGKFELSDLPHRFSLARVFTEPLGEARVLAFASEQEAGRDRAARAELGQQAPVHVCADLSVKSVAERDKLGGLGHGLDIVQRVPLLHAVKVALLDEQGHPVMINEEQVELLLELGVLRVQWHVPIVEQSESGLKVVDHNFLVLGCRRDEPFGISLGCRSRLLGPHLQDIDHLSNIITRRFNQIRACIFIDVYVFSLGDLHD